MLGELTLTVAKSNAWPQWASTFAKSSARSALSLLAPRLRPTTAPFGRCSIRLAIVTIPSLLKPKRLMTARSSVRRNRRGLALPLWACGVAAPTSKKPNPARDSGLIAWAFLSNPAASPSGLSSCNPAIWHCSREDVIPWGVAVGASPI